MLEVQAMMWQTAEGRLLIMLVCAYLLGALSWEGAIQFRRWRRRKRRERSGWSNYYK